MSGRPTLIGCAHGTRSPTGQATVRALLDEVRRALPDVDVREAYVDVHGPSLDDVVASIEPAGGGTTAVVVPLLLAGGYHVHHDIAKAVEGRDDVVAVPALGPDSRLVRIVVERLRDAGASPAATVVLAPAGSSDPRSTADTERTADMLRTAWGGPVRVGYAAGMHPSVPDAVLDARAFGEDEEVVVASFLLAPGVFQERLADSGATLVTAPLAPHRSLVDIVVERYMAGCDG
ncbi:sirohydrochlorin chelatase [Demequina capsici]|uniref:Sirohydrochlorin chelatase n=1 Tax=Demequina capsici TaxID=3075620 RepID=A0AA96FF86_9MICO|nr:MULTISPECIES: sirohydrochlorin chelatase [unclassified Demequina]WNM25446.1 sirohydrochlorin chelatase [Demequina sp. OYTSA14]WNM28327.1 sirohydrochlorin chelatase [Demequina sp. PMTSA13]